MSRNSFVVFFECSNCGNNWNTVYLSGCKVTYKGSTNIAVYKKYTGFISDPYELIKCPICEIDDCIKIIKREPTKSKEVMEKEIAKEHKPIDKTPLLEWNKRQTELPLLTERSKYVIMPQ